MKRFVRSLGCGAALVVSLHFFSPSLRAQEGTNLTQVDPATIPLGATFFLVDSNSDLLGPPAPMLPDFAADAPVWQIGDTPQFLVDCSDLVFPTEQPVISAVDFARSLLSAQGLRGGGV